MNSLSKPTETPKEMLRHHSVRGEKPADNGLYKKREKIYIRHVDGLYARLRLAAMALLHGLYYGLPWLEWSGRQAILFDLPARKFYLWELVLWPQDFILLALLMIAAAVSLIFFTTLAGRLWCGYSCPQTVWTGVFVWMERWAEGDERAQRKLDKSPISLGKVRKKLTKHTMWIVFSLFTGFTFVGYFTPIDELANKILTGQTGGWENFWVLFYSFATYGNAGWMREQVCLYMCPYARFQSAMFDHDTLTIAYDKNRGEPRGRRRIASVSDNGQIDKSLGDCIDCTMCVQVCPTGIDIREGSQYACIDCAACIDACNSIMDKVGYQRDLIKYTSARNQEGKKSRIWRPRVAIYSVILMLLIVFMGSYILARSPVELDVIRDRNVLYRITDAGQVENVYTLKLVNKEERSRRVRVIVKPEMVLSQREAFFLAPGQVTELPISAHVESKNTLTNQSSRIHWQVIDIETGRTLAEAQARFIMPVSSNQ